MKFNTSLILIFSLILVQSCASSKKSAEVKQETPPTVVATPSATVATEAPPTAPAAHSAREVGPVSAEKALGWLKNGNRRFLKSFLRKDGQSKSDRQTLAAGQHPHSIILTCSDSRVPPELVFDQKLGEIFVIRNAGNNSDLGAIASIEYAIEHLGVNLVVVMGHESCGAVKAAASSTAESKSGSPYIDKLLSQVRSRIDLTKTASQGFIREGWENTGYVATELIKKSQILRDAVEAGSVKIQTALYHLDGEVEWEHKVQN